MLSTDDMAAFGAGTFNTAYDDPADSTMCYVRTVIQSCDPFRLANALRMMQCHKPVISYLDDGAVAVTIHIRRGVTLVDLVHGPFIRIVGSAPDFSELKHLLRCILMQLDMRHAVGIAHNDVKAENIIALDGGYDLIDDGMSIDTRILPRVALQPYMTSSSVRAPWMCEGLDGVCCVDASKGDVWALGVTALGLLNGAPLVTFPDDMEGDTVTAGTACYFRHLFASADRSDVCPLLAAAPRALSDLLLQMTALRANDVPSASAALLHPAFRD